jgi:hypothetical protein
MQAIQTRFLGPTNNRGARVKAYSEGFPRGVIVEWDYAEGIEDNHRRAVEAFVMAKEWHGLWVMGGAPGGGTVWVCIAGRGGADRARLDAMHASLVALAPWVCAINVRGAA